MTLYPEHPGYAVCDGCSFKVSKRNAQGAFKYWTKHLGSVPDTWLAVKTTKGITRYCPACTAEKRK